MTEVSHQQTVTLNFTYSDDGILRGRLRVTSPDLPGLVLAVPLRRSDTLFADLGKAIQLLLRVNHGFPPALSMAELMGAEIVSDDRVPENTVVVEKNGKFLDAFKIEVGEPKIAD